MLAHYSLVLWLRFAFASVNYFIIFIFNYLLDDWSFCGWFCAVCVCFYCFTRIDRPISIWIHTDANARTFLMLIRKNQPKPTAFWRTIISFFVALNANERTGARECVCVCVFVSAKWLQFVEKVLLAFYWGFSCDSLRFSTARLPFEEWRALRYKSESIGITNTRTHRQQSARERESRLTKEPHLLRPNILILLNSIHLKVFLFTQ